MASIWRLTLILLLRDSQESTVGKKMAAAHSTTMPCEANTAYEALRKPCLTYSTNYFQRLTLESWYTNLEQTPLNRCQQLPAPYKRLIHDGNETDKRTSNAPT